MPQTQFDPTTWIDEQRAAGGSAKNVFDEILKASASIRTGQTRHADYRVERRIAQVHQIRQAAAFHDRAIDPRGTQAQTFDEMMKRWKGLR